MNMERRTTYFNERFGALPFCPGCGHTVLLKALDKALVELKLDPKRVVVVTDIGCIGLSDRYFVTNAFHGLHGRSITYACGMKLARPDLVVIVLMGDGGCGIGGTHLINVARRNIGITLLVGNNFNYGMTGGQHSVTTPNCGVTSSTPQGNLEFPMDLCATVAAAGGSWVSRSTMFDKELHGEIIQAIQHPGFSMLDVWELCTAYYVPRNRFGKKQLLSLLDELGFKLGTYASKPRPEYSVQYKSQKTATTKTHKSKEPPSLKPLFKNEVGRQIGIVLAGSAGQKIKSAATLFAQASMLAGLNATQKDDYPITVQTGHSVSEIIISPQTIDYTGIDTPDYLVVLSEEGVTRTHSIFARLKRNCTIYADASLALPKTKAKIRRVPLNFSTLQTGRASVSVLVLACLAKDSGLFPVSSLVASVQGYQSQKIAETNLKAIEVGADLLCE